MFIKPGDVSQEVELSELRKILLSRKDEASSFSICLEKTKKTDLAQFNALVAIYVKLKRLNKSLQFQNCKDDSLKNFVRKTQFDHVFTS